MKWRQAICLMKEKRRPTGLFWGWEMANSQLGKSSAAWVPANTEREAHFTWLFTIANSSLLIMSQQSYANSSQKALVLINCVILNFSSPSIYLARPIGKQTSHFYLLFTELPCLITHFVIDWLLACESVDLGTRCHHVKYASISFAFSPAAMLCKIGARTISPT